MASSYEVCAGTALIGYSQPMVGIFAYIIISSVYSDVDDVRSMDTLDASRDDQRMQ